MAVRRLPDLAPEQVTRLQDALLANADALLRSALAVLDLGQVALARSLAILGLEESGKAIAVHERRVAMGSAPDGATFRCDWLDELWASHEKKLQTVHRFLVMEPYWFDVQPPDPEQNAAYLGTINSWSRRHDRSKQRGFYVELGRTGEVMTPEDVADEAALREVIARVNQIGWQLRLGEHLEGKRQDEQEAGVPPASDDDFAWFDQLGEADDGDGGGDGGGDDRDFRAELRQSMREGIPGEPLPNAAYRFNPSGTDKSSFRNLGRPGYEAETRELLNLAGQLDEEGDG
ncbi:MAG TPA: AbiV family abortive infection protein [Propionicimonas sp.]|jgi:AbiV family abortive infection protein